MRLANSLKVLYVDMLAESQDCALIAMMKEAKNLQNFYLAHTEVIQDLESFDHVDYLPFLARSNALLAGSPAALREVRLCSVGLHPSTLLAGLWSWRHTLQDLGLIMVYLTSRSNDWLEVFRFLESSMGSLENFDAMCLMERSRGIRLIHEKRVQGQVVLLGKDGRPGLDVGLIGPKEIQQVLRMNIASGMNETHWKAENVDDAGQ